jgi:penicillin-binding protein 1C
LLNEVGPDRLLAKLRAAGVSLDMPKDDTQASLAIALGGVGISLENLSLLYAGIANGGMVRQPRFRPEDPGGAVRPLLSRDAAWAVSDSLADSAPPPGRASPLAKDGGRRVAFKTGTSFGFRDAWAVGFDSNYTVGVWLGRPDGSGRLGDTGAKTAVPIMLRIFDVLANAEHDVAADRPKQSILAARNDLPLRLRRFVQGNRSEQPFNRERPLEIEFPPNGTTVKLEQRDGAYLPINVVAVGGRGPFRWYVGKQTIADAQGAERLTWTPEGRGQTEFTVIDADGRVAKSGAWLE